MRKVSSIIAVALVGLVVALPATAGRSSAQETISIPKIGVTAKIGTLLSRGAIYWKRVGRPGQGTTIAIAAHDITPVPGFRGHGPFHDIDRLARGDKVTVTHAGKRYAYRVTGQRVIPGTNRHIADLTRYERLLLTTCWPRGSSKYRLVVYARPAKL
ncbi:MAG: class E sortase [Actinobacteria bacterium]|nr:MAG: class E sortase [Actinomycetota bacterium]